MAERRGGISRIAHRGASAAGAVWVIGPAFADAPEAPSGGQLYNHRVCRGLTDAGWAVHRRAVPGTWPWPDDAAKRMLAGELAAVPDGTAVLIDGLVACAAVKVAEPAAARLSMVVLVHMPLGEQLPGHHVRGAQRGESRMLSAACGLITTSAWTRDRLLALYPLAPDAVRVATPGVDPGTLAPGTYGGGELLCVGSVAPHKGHDVLLAALSGLTGRAWHCRLVGPLDRDPDFVAALHDRARAAGISDRIDFSGTLTGAALEAAYTRADVLVHASRAETYGMVVTEALAHGLPVIATAVGGVPEALGRSADDRPPGILVRPDDAPGLASALRDWLDRADLRERLRDAARDRRSLLTGWEKTAAQVASVLAGLAGSPVAASTDSRMTGRSGSP